MAASMPLPSMSESKHSVYFRCLLAIAILIWPVSRYSPIMAISG
jgi:hypothetical protein